LSRQLLTSDSSSSKEAEELTGDFTVDAGTQRVKGRVASDFLKRITVTLSNVKLIELPDSVVFDLIAQRKGSCTKAVEFRQTNGQKISMIKSVIAANARYKLEFDSGIDGNIRSQLTHQFATSMGLTTGVRSEDTIEGSGLYWGVRDDEALATISPNQPPRTGAGGPRRLLSPDKSAQVILDVQKHQ
jgi:hypothetical protein